MTDIYTLDDQVKQVLVDSLRRGFVEFLEEKVEKKQTMKVSTGYSWTRGNHIDNEINNGLTKKGMGTSKVFTSGSWKFLRFELPLNNHMIWLVQKPISFVEKPDNLATQNSKHQNLISQWGNQVDAKYSNLFNGSSQQISLLDIGDDDVATMEDNKTKSMDQADVFYLLTL